uniref:Sel1 domain protein repeat-containing protein n=1 Tax=Rhodopseudomonas palustris (strain BisA53) TaxID=316055 RepID=Q07TR2_RHOP5
MNSRVPWSVEGIEPAVRERAEAAARRAGMTLGDWISAQVGEMPPQFRQPPDPSRPPLPEQDAREVAEIHQRLDSIARQIEQMSRPAVRSEPGVARQLNDAISRLDARLAQIGEPPRAADPSETATERVERAAAQVYAASPYAASPPLSPGSLDFAIAEIAARQHELDAIFARPAPPRASAPIAPPLAPAMPAAPSADFSGLERQLRKITDQIESLQRPDGVEQSIAAFRAELAEIRKTITEAMPRRAIESIESQILSLAQRIDEGRQCGFDAQALANVERALTEIREVLRTLTPAEQLAGFDEAIRNLGGKIDMIVRTSGDPGTLQQLEGAIAALRAIVSNVASNEALSRLNDDVQALSSKIDQLARADNTDSFAALEQRMAALMQSLESRERPAPVDPSPQLEGALQALSDRLDHLPVGNDGASAFAHLEQRVSVLLERLEAASDSRGGHLGRVEEGLQDILRHLERQQDSFASALIASTRNAPDTALVDNIKRDISDLRLGQSETDRRTQDSLEAVHNTLGHVVDRLAMIEGDLRGLRAAPAPAPVPAPAAAPQPAAPAAKAETPKPVPPPPSAMPPRPELPNPAAAGFDSAPRQFPPPPPAEPAPSPSTSRSLHDILDPRPAAPPAAPTPPAPEPRGPQRMTINPELPPDHPLEPGTRPQSRGASPSERIAASEDAISDLPAAKNEPTNSSNFIAAARRAAQAAAAAAQREKAPAIKKKPAAAADPSGKGSRSTLGSKIRSLLVGVSVVVIVLGTFKMAMQLLDGDGAPAPAAETSSPPSSLAPPAADHAAPATPAAPAQPSMTSPTPIDRQSLFGPATAPTESAPPPAGDVTGTIPAQPHSAAPLTMSTRAPTRLVAIPAGEKLPEAIGGASLRAAALKGDPNAAYEIGLRYAEARGVAANFEEAAKWYDRAAQAGIVPAIFRIGTLNEKGLGVKKDPDAARRYYILAAERGNAKAMHNLAVMEADGGSRGANYKSAAHWFRKAAERGVADSQFNLGILYARGIGVEQNLAESFKWFSLAAAQGDQDAGRKRDDVGKKLDAQSLAAAKLAIQTFVPAPQPDDAVNVVTPPGGWDSALTTPAKSALAKRASR